MSKRLPKHSCKVGHNKSSDEYELGAYRDKIGNVEFLFWKLGVGFKDKDAIRLRIDETKKLRDWLTKVIDYVERN